MSVTQLLKDLVAIPSVNPMGRDLDGPEFLEQGMTDYLENWFTDLGVEWRRMELQPRRSNIVARFAGDPDRPAILLDAHQDTVPVDGMIIPPFEPSEENGRIYGRGSCDIKGGMASMLTAFARIVREQPTGAGDVIVSCSCDEEHQMSGILDLASRWQADGDSDDWVTRRPDAAIILEPTSLDIVVAHRGVTRWKLRTCGRAAHSSDPTAGVNAIYRMAEAVTHLRHYAHDLQTNSAPHPLCGPPTLSVGRIEGGISVNVVPPESSIEIDRRVLPGEDQSQVMPLVEQYLRKRLDFDFDMLPPWCEVGPLSDASNRDLADGLLQHVEAVVGTRQQIGVPYGTNAAATDAAGVPTVVFGPGSIDQAHTKDEWIAVDQLEQASNILYRYLTQP